MSQQLLTDAETQLNAKDVQNCLDMLEAVVRNTSPGEREEGKSYPYAFIVRGGAGAGKSCLIRKLMVTVLNDPKHEFIPFFIPVADFIARTNLQNESDGTNNGGEQKFWDSTGNIYNADDSASFGSEFNARSGFNMRSASVSSVTGSGISSSDNHMAVGAHGPAQGFCSDQDSNHQNANANCSSVNDSGGGNIVGKRRRSDLLPVQEEDAEAEDEDKFPAGNSAVSKSEDDKSKSQSVFNEDDYSVDSTAGKFTASVVQQAVLNRNNLTKFFKLEKQTSWCPDACPNFTK